MKSRNCIEEYGLLPNSTWTNCSVDHFLHQVWWIFLIILIIEEDFELFASIKARYI